MQLKVNEIFKSIQGETTFTGLPCVFIRLTGCNLRCSYCDTAYAFDKGQSIDINNIYKTVRDFGVKLVCVTGGEPLIQEGSRDLIKLLSESGFLVLVETNGSVKVDSLPDNVIIIMDIKCPDSGESDKMDLDNLKIMRPKDEIKFVLSSKRDYTWAKNFILTNGLDGEVKLLFCATSGLLEPVTLAEWMLHDNLNVRLQIQLHKYLGVN